MGSFTNGILVGLGIALLVTPKTGKEMRQLVSERLSYLSGTPPEDTGLKQSVQNMAERVQEVQQQSNRAAQMGTTAQAYAQRTAESASSAQEDMENLLNKTGKNTPSTPSSGKRPTPPPPRSTR